MKLKFGEDGKFRILLIADAQDTDKPQKETIGIIKNMVTRSNPDLVVFLGDNIAGSWNGANEKTTQKAVDNIIEPLLEKNIPFAIVFGNHDHEGLTRRCGYEEKDAKKFILSAFQKYDNCLAIDGEEMTGYCNYNLTIKSSKDDKDVFNLWFIDSNTYAEEGGYGYIQPDQTEWYIRKSNELKNKNGGKPLTSLLFQHIPVPEVYKFLDEKNTYGKDTVKGQCALYKGFYKANELVEEGGFLEGPCCADVFHNQFETWKNQGDIIGAFFGHDHPNDYLGEVDGIKLCAVPAAGYYSYGQNHGARTVTLDENDLSKFETKLFHSDEILGHKVRPVYKSNHGYKEYTKKFLPAVAGLAAGFASFAIGSFALIKIAQIRRMLK